MAQQILFGADCIRLLRKLRLSSTAWLLENCTQEWNVMQQGCTPHGFYKPRAKHSRGFWHTFTPLSYKPLCAIPILHLTCNLHATLHTRTSWWASSYFPSLLQTSYHHKQEAGSLLKPIHPLQTGWWKMSGLSSGTSALPKNTLHHHSSTPLSLSYPVLLRGLFCPDRQKLSLQGQDGTSTECGAAQDGRTDGSSIVHCLLLPGLNCPYISETSLSLLSHSLSIWRSCLCLYIICSTRIPTVAFLLGPGSLGIPTPHHTLHLVHISQHLPEGVSPKLVKTWGMQSQYLMAKGQSASHHLTYGTFGVQHTHLAPLMQAATIWDR